MSAISSNGLGKIAFGAILYLAPKALSRFCSQPEQHSPLDRIDRIREKIFGFKENVRSLVGEKIWFTATKIIGENAWISYFALTYLTQRVSFFVGFESGLKRISAFFGICSLSCLLTHFAKRTKDRNLVVSPPVKNKIMELARQLEIDQISNEEVADKIMERAQGTFMSSVSVRREMRKFTLEDPAKTSIVITLLGGLNKWSLYEQDHSDEELQQATCAALGSSEENDQNALKNVIRSFGKFEVCISQDFQDLSGFFSNSR